MTRMKKVLLFGDVNVDLILLLPEIPGVGREVYATKTEAHLGGAICNTAAMLRSLGQASALFGALGDDHWSEFIGQELDLAGVEYSLMVRKQKGSSGLIVIPVTAEGERTMMSHRGANLLIRPADIPEAIFKNVCLLQFSGYDFLESPQKETAHALIDLARQLNIPISMDTGLTPVTLKPEEIHKALPGLEILITGEEEARILSGFEDIQSQMGYFKGLGVQYTAIKLGGEGAWLGWQKGLMHLPAFQVDVLDTTGAGDAFSAGLIYGYLRNCGPEECLVLANALGGMATELVGSARFSKAQLVKFLQKKLQEEASHPFHPYAEGLIKVLRVND